MIALVVAVNKNVPLARLDAVAGEVERIGMTVHHILKSLNLISGTIEDRRLIAEIHRVPDVQSVMVK